MSAQSFDLVIAGAGPAGSVCATLLARASWKVLLVDSAGPAFRQRPAEILAPSTLRLLRSHGLPVPGTKQSAALCRGVLGLWSGPRPDLYDYELLGCEAGLSIARPQFDAELVAGAEASGCTVLREARVERACLKAGDPWEIQVSARRASCVCHASFLIEATGRAAGSWACPQSARRVFEDRLVALAATTQEEARHTNVLLLEVGREGWWYASRHLGGPSWIVYLTDADFLPRSSGERASYLWHEFAKTELLRQEFPMLSKPVSAVATVDARTSRRTNVCYDRGLAIGDAAFSVDPLSGSGIQRAVTSAAQAARAVSEFLASGASDSLHRYALQSQDDYHQWVHNKRSVYATAVSTMKGGEFWQRRVRTSNSDGAETPVPDPRHVANYAGVPDTMVGSCWSQPTGVDTH